MIFCLTLFVVSGWCHWLFSLKFFFSGSSFFVDPFVLEDHWWSIDFNLCKMDPLHACSNLLDFCGFIPLPLLLYYNLWVPPKTLLGDFEFYFRFQYYTIQVYNYASCLCFSYPFSTIQLLLLENEQEHNRAVCDLSFCVHIRICVGVCHYIYVCFMRHTYPEASLQL
jgi:hypothetical protein